MTSTFLNALLWFCALGCGLMGGVYFAFSAFIMRALERIGPAQGSAAMNSINTVILRSLFMPLFLGTTIGATILAVIGIARFDAPGSLFMLAGGILYVLGMFVVTMLFNVPLNNQLVSDGPGNWAKYLAVWTRWNHVRTLASLVASALFFAALT